MDQVLTNNLLGLLFIFIRIRKVKGFV